MKSRGQLLANRWLLVVGCWLLGGHLLLSVSSWLCWLNAFPVSVMRYCEELTVLPAVWRAPGRPPHKRPF